MIKSGFRCFNIRTNQTNESTGKQREIDSRKDLHIGCNTDDTICAELLKAINVDDNILFIQMNPWTVEVGTVL